MAFRRGDIWYLGEFPTTAQRAGGVPVYALILRDVTVSGGVQLLSVVIGVEIEDTENDGEFASIVLRHEHGLGPEVDGAIELDCRFVFTSRLTPFQAAGSKHVGQLRQERMIEVAKATIAGLQLSEVGHLLK